MFKPVLSPNAVLEALEHMHSGEPLPDSNPLTQFYLVRQRLLQPEYPGGKHTELKAIRDLLEEIFLTLLGNDRRTAQDGLQFISQVFQEQHQQRQVYSLLYYWYMRPDLGYTIQEISQAGGLVERTLRRRRENGLDYLVLDLIDREVEARRQHRNQLLRTRIPFPAGRSLYGREWLIERVIDALSNGPVLLTGVPGIGKTSLAAAVAHRLLPEIDDLYWIYLLPDVDVSAQITRQLNPDSFQDKSVDAYLAGHTVLLVLENLQPHHRLDNLFLQHALALCTANEAFQTWEGVIMPVPPLEKNEARKFFATIQGTTENSLFPEIYEAAGGIPGMMQEYVRWQQLLPSKHIPDHLSIHQYYEGMWETLPFLMKRLWLGMTLLSTERLNLEDITSLFRVTEQDIFEPVRRHILTLHEGYQISPGAKQFLQTQAVHLDFEAWIPAKITAPDVRPWLVMLSNGLHRYLSPAGLDRLLRKLSPVIPAAGLWEYWKTTIQYLKPVLQPARVEFEEARLLRWQGQFVSSMRLMSKVIQEMGQQGDFQGYAYALLEMATAAFYRNEMTAALTAVQDAGKVFKRLQDEDGLLLAQKLQARAFLKTHPREALDMLRNLPDDDAVVLALTCEAALLNGETSEAVEYAWRAIQLVELDSPHHGRALCTLGIVLRADGQAKTAIDYQQQAINILNMTTDIIGLARARNNLGVLFYETQNVILAKSNWRIALDLFRSVQDAVGLQTVRANLNAGSKQILPFS